MEYIEFEKEFNQLISKYSIKSNNITKQLYNYMECILESNNNINLTSITNPNEFIVKHFIDSLIISEYIDGNKILDVGTGAGFPGIPLAIDLGTSVPLAVGAVISAGVFGSHICFYSDATVITSAATGCDNFAHAKTQMPYGILAAIITCAFYLVAGFLVK